MSHFTIDSNNHRSGLNRNAIFLLGMLDSNSKQKGYAYGTNKYYAQKLSCSTRTVSNLLKLLVDRKRIEITNSKSFKRKIYVRNNKLTS